MIAELKRFTLIALAILYSLSIGIISSSPVFSASLYVNASDSSEHSILATVSANLIGQASLSDQTPPLAQSSLFIIKKINGLLITTAPFPLFSFIPNQQKEYLSFTQFLHLYFSEEDIGFPFHGFW